MAVAFFAFALVATASGYKTSGDADDASLRHLRTRNAQSEASASLKVDIDPPWVDIPIEKPEEKPPSTCGPKCRWDCGKSNCHSMVECDPVCAPPKCQTTCSTSVEKCDTRCGEPLCAVVCPQTECLTEDCPPSLKCKTVCAPPVCTTSCRDCKTTCEKPVCSWNCNTSPKCPQPKCRLDCVDLDFPAELSPVSGNSTAREKARQEAARLLEESLEKEGRMVINTGEASLDPKVLEEPPKGPAAVAADPVPGKDAVFEKMEAEVASETTTKPLETNTWLWGALSAPKVDASF